MGSLKIIKPGLMTSIQDAGRNGLAYYAVPHSGVMDKESADLANVLLGNNISYPVIECTSIAPSIEFLSDGIIAISGASCNYKLNSLPIDTSTAIHVSKDDILTSGPYTDGLRGYIALDGMIQRKKCLGSLSYNSYPYNSIIEKSLLKRNDIVEWRSEKKDTSHIMIKQGKISDARLQLIAGPEYHYLTEEAKRSLVTQNYCVTNDSNRMGIRLSSDSLIAEIKKLKHSVPVFPGIIQLTTEGQLIVIMRDGQTTGGYPRIAYMRTEEMNKLSQVRIGEGIRFSF